uniref:Retrovirus-related Pol polyprotein from transposon TNT 1-94 n=1 Tax=Cajanus cajan TaxID=3821 RepID=A0A151SEP6_CAJCA|nr:Retrovirus-related Pol polyprotein from transposon TNT 1-94 [Cajanus cajan]
MDVKTAFLYGKLDEEILMQQPEGFVEKGKEDHVCKLNKSLYGLKQSPRKWNRRFDEFMTKINFNRSQYDNCVYFKFPDNAVLIILLLVSCLKEYNRE